MCRTLLSFILFVGISFSEFDNVHRRHEFLFTFKGPMITVPNSSEVPFFELGGLIIVGSDRIRLTTSLPNQLGWIWSKNSSTFSGFQIDLTFRIAGTGRRGANGLALWVVQDKHYGGPTLGFSRIWKGLGILFDTFNNDENGKGPIVVGIVNDGTKVYSSETSGKDISVGHCARDFRNMPFETQCRVTYFNHVLVVTISPGLSKDHDEMEECFRVNVDLPNVEYYIGLTSSTGRLADDHDVMKMEVHSLSELKDMKEEDEKKRLEQQKKYVEEYQQKMDNIANTEAADVKKKSESSEELDERGINQNLMAIWHEISGQHQLMRSLIKSVSLMKEGMTLEEKITLMSNMNAVRTELGEVKNSVESVNRKIDSGSGSGYQTEQGLSQVNNNIDGLKTDISNVLEKIGKVKETLNHITDNMKKEAVNDRCGSCISFPVIVMMGFLQSFLVIGFLIYQKTKDNAAKKFY